MTQRLINYLTIVLFFIPFTLLVVDNQVLFPFITTKALIFRFLTTLSLFLIVWIYLLNPKSFPYKNYLILAFVIFFLSNIVSNILSVNPFRSFWGNAERMEGLWSLFFYLIYFFSLFTLFSFAPSARKIIFYSFLIVSCLISLIQINQGLFEKTARPYSTLGNATYIGFLNILTIILILFFIFDTKKIFEKFVYILLIFLNVISLLISQTRGSILAYLAAVLAFLFFYSMFSQIEKKKKILILLSGVVFLILFFFFLRTDFALKIPGISRLSETLKNPVSVFPRLFAWKIFLEGFKDRPIFGWGQETMPIVFFKYFNPEIFKYEQAIFDRPHNKFIEVLSSLGVVGFLSWFLIFVAFFYYLLKKNFNIYQKASLFSFIIAYFVQNFSLFDMQASYLILFFALSFVAPKTEINEDKERFIRPYLILTGGICSIFILIHFQHYHVVKSIITFLREENPQVSAKGFDKISKIAGPFLTEEANMVMTYLSNNIRNIKDFQTLNTFFEIIKFAYYKEPWDYRLANNYINTKTILADIKKSSNLDFNEDLKDVELVYQRLLKEYYRFPEVYTGYAYFLINFGRREDAYEILKKGEEISKNYPFYFLIEANIFKLINENDKAYEKVKHFLASKATISQDYQFKLILDILLSKKDVENSKMIIKEWLTVNNSSSTKENINEILKNYNMLDVLKLDKN
jgi:O-antigen ligase